MLVIYLWSLSKHLDDKKGTILCFFHILILLYSHQCFSNGWHPRRSLLVQEAHDHGWSSPNLPKAENTEFEFPNVKTSYELNIPSELLSFSSSWSGKPHCHIVESNIESVNPGLEILLFW